MNKIYWLILGWMNFLAWTSVFMCLWIRALGLMNTLTFVGILGFSVLCGFFSLALMKDAWEKSLKA